MRYMHRKLPINQNSGKTSAQKALSVGLWTGGWWLTAKEAIAQPAAGHQASGIRKS